MKRLYWYVLKQFIGPLFAVFFVVMFVLLMQFVWMYVDDIVGKGLDTSDIVEFFYYGILFVVPRALPLTILLASLMTFGNLGERLELLSIKAAGVSISRIMRPLLILVVFISLFAFQFSNKIYPMVNRNLRTLLYDIRTKKPEINIKPGVFNYILDKLVIKIDSKDLKTNMMYGIMMYETLENNEYSIALADSGKFTSMGGGVYSMFTLYSGRSYQNFKDENNRYDENRQPYQRDTFRQLDKLNKWDNSLQRSDASIFGGFYASKNFEELKIGSDSLIRDYNNSYNEFSSRISTLGYRIGYIVREEENFDSLAVAYPQINNDSLFTTQNKEGQEKAIASAITFARNVKKDLEDKISTDEHPLTVIRKYVSEMHKKFTLSFACLIFFFIGAPLGAIIRKGGFGMPVVISVLFFIVYFIIDNFGLKFATEGLTATWFGVWMSSLVLLPIGIFLTYKASTDSAILNIENYLKIFKIKKKNTTTL